MEKESWSHTEDFQGHKTLANQLIQGLEVAKQLRSLLNATSSSTETGRDLLALQRILSSYEKALLILDSSGSIGPQPQSGCPSDDLVKESQAPHFDASKKKRKTMSRRTVKVANGLEGLIDDGFSWRKYGQKDILGAKFPRSYYRCTYRNLKGCLATKQAQRSDEDPDVFEVDYLGEHTCKIAQTNHPLLPRPSKPEHTNTITFSKPAEPQEIIESDHHSVVTSQETTDISSFKSFTHFFQQTTTSSRASSSCIIDHEDNEDSWDNYLFGDGHESCGSPNSELSNIETEHAVKHLPEKEDNEDSWDNYLFGDGHESCGSPNSELSNIETGYTSMMRQTAEANELIQGMEVAKQLRLQLNAKSSPTEIGRDLLVQKILSSYEKALMILNSSGSIGTQLYDAAVVPGSSKSLNESPRSDDLDGVVKESQAPPFDASKKRKTMSRRTVKVANGLDDGFCWKKHGQKAILGAKFPRSYYRCTYRNLKGCWATKQVQRSDEDPDVFEVTYHGEHTCKIAQTNPPNPENREYMSTIAFSEPSEPQEIIECDDHLDTSQETAAAPSFSRMCKHLGPAQELLNEFCSLQSTQNDVPKRTQKQKQQSLHSLEFLDLQKRKRSLLSMIEEVERRYRQYCDQMKLVVSSFELEAGEGAAAVYSSLASKAMSRHFRSLKDAIVTEIDATRKAMGEKDPVAPGTSRGETPRLRVIDQALRHQRALQQMSIMESHPWRPQRGLPENFLHPSFDLKTVDLLLLLIPSRSIALNLRAECLVEVCLPGGNGALVQDLVNLKQLNLSCSSFTRMPHLSRACKLQRLDLHSCNNLVDVSSIQYLTKLEYINLKGCTSLACLPSLMALKFLLSLDVSDCTNLRRLPPSLGCLSSLTALDLRNCKRIQKLPKGILRLKSVQTLSISGCSMLLEQAAGPEGMLIEHQVNPTVHSSSRASDEVSTSYQPVDNYVSKIPLRQPKEERISSKCNSTASKDAAEPSSTTQDLERHIEVLKGYMNMPVEAIHQANAFYNIQRTIDSLTQQSSDSREGASLQDVMNCLEELQENVPETMARMHDARVSRGSFQVKLAHLGPSFVQAEEQCSELAARLLVISDQEEDLDAEIERLLAKRQELLD